MQMTLVLKSLVPLVVLIVLLEVYLPRRYHSSAGSCSLRPCPCPSFHRASGIVASVMVRLVRHVQRLLQQWSRRPPCTLSTSAACNRTG